MCKKIAYWDQWDAFLSRKSEGCLLQDASENLLSKNIGVTVSPQDRFLDVLTEKMCGNTHVLYQKKFSIVTMTTDRYRELEEERICFYGKGE